MKTDLNDATLVVRNREYLRYRYQQRPERRYDIACLYEDDGGCGNRRNPLVGLFVLKQETHRCMLMDIACPLQHLPKIIDQARRECEQLKKQELYTWITSSHADCFDHPAGTRHITDIEIAYSEWSPSPQKTEICNTWWLMPGDTDFL